jgi:hypothetical protein
MALESMLETCSKRLKRRKRKRPPTEGGLFVRPQHLAGVAIDNVDALASNALDSFQAGAFGRVCDPASQVLGCYGTAIKNSGHQLNIDATICLSVAQDQKGA